MRTPYELVYENSYVDKSLAFSLSVETPYHFSSSVGTFETFWFYFETL